MIRNSTKLTAILVAAASVISSIPAAAAVKLGTKDGTIEKGVAFKGTFIKDIEAMMMTLDCIIIMETEINN